MAADDCIRTIMLPATDWNGRGPLVVMLPWLGGSALTWTEVATRLTERGMRCVAIDLPGFGDAHHQSGAHQLDGYTVEAMAAAVATTIAALHGAGTDGWLLAGHSMGGKVATLVARAAADSPNKPDGLAGLRGLVLISPSPPSPEPMTEARRAHMLADLGHSTGDPSVDRARAQAFVDDNTGKLALDPAIRNRTVDDVLRMNRAAFRAWLEHGSYEDVSPRVGVLPQPALILAGSEEPALGLAVQRRLTRPHFETAELVELAACGHLGPLERPGEVASRIAAFAEHLGLTLQPESRPLSGAFEDLLTGPRTSLATRAVLQSRMSPPGPTPSVWTLEETMALRALVDCVLPRPGFDLTARVQRTLAQGKGDGWRFDTLPPDNEAWRCGLRSLDAAARRAHGTAFVGLPDRLQLDLLQSVRSGETGKGLLGTLGFGESANGFDAGQMQQWFEDVRGELTRLYVADPRTLERMGYTGFADETGFTQIRLGEREVFEI